MSNLTPLFVFLFALALGIDLLLSAAYTALRIVHRSRHPAQREPSLPKLLSFLAWMESPANWEVNLRTVQGLARFLLAGLLFIWLALWQEPPIAWFSVLGLVLLGGWVLLLLEAWIENRVARNAEAWASRLSPLVRALLLLLSPLLLPLLLLQRSRTDESVTEADLMNLVEAGQESGVIEQEERRMIFSIFRLGDTLAREIMVPRIDIIALEVNTPLKEAVETLIRFGHSRIPVYRETIDDILGLLYAKDLLRVWQQGNDETTSLQDLLRPAYFVPEAKRVDELLAELQAQRIHLAIVVDEYGGVAGLVTLEDIVEEIVGEIQDEYDQAEEVPYQPIGAEEYLFLGRVDLDDFNEIVGSHLPKEEADTLAGLIYSRLGRVPASGESVQVEDLLLTVEQVSGRRIRKVRVKRLSTAAEMQREDNHAER